jgi:hypothetical protein
MDNRQKYINIDSKRFDYIIPFNTFMILKDNALIYKDFMGSVGFTDDYLVLHVLIQKYNPQSFCEIGTHEGEGTRIICNAMNGRPVYSIDLPPDYDETKEVYKDWTSEKPKEVGKRCEYPYIQLFGNSKDFDFSSFYPIEGWYIDGRHNYKYCYADSINALKSKPKIIIWHDSLMDGVQKAIYQIIDENKDNYTAYYCGGTRVSWIVRK